MRAGIFVKFRWVAEASEDETRSKETPALEIGSIGGFDLNFIADDADFIDVGLYPRIIAPDSVSDAKSPGMPRADDSSFEEFTVGQRSSHVRAAIVDRVILATEIEDSD